MQTRWLKRTNSNNIYSWAASCLPPTQVIPHQGEGGFAKKTNMHNVILIWIIVSFALLFIQSLFSVFGQVHHLLFCLPLHILTPSFIRCIESFWCFIVIEATELQLFVHTHVMCVQISFKGTSVKSDEKMSLCYPLVFRVFSSLFSNICQSLLPLLSLSFFHA